MDDTRIFDFSIIFIEFLVRFHQEWTKMRVQKATRRAK